MLNLVNLLTSLAITFGVSTNLTPICDEQKKPIIETPLKLNDSSNNEYVNEYSIQLTPNNIATAHYQLSENINPTTYEGVQYDRESRYNLSASTNYINVLGNIYKTLMTSTGAWEYPNTSTQTAIYMQNYFDIWQNNDNYAEPTTRILYVLKLTPYNFNIDTNTSTILSINIKNDFGNNIYGQQQTITNLWLRKAVYVSSRSNWDTFLQKQLTKYTAKNILDDIEDVNNGFYYSKDVNLTEYSNEVGAEYLNIQVEFTMEPKRDNYLIIDIMPVVQAYLDNQVFPYAHVPTIATAENIDQELTTQVININGTNIIPTGTYEVLDIPGLMWEILTMPFAFVSQAFNLTLFPGTPYQINISNLFLSIIGVFVFIFLIGLIIKLKAGDM